MLEFLPGNITLMRIANKRGPLLGRKSFPGKAPVRILARARAAKAEGSSVARMVQDPQHSRVIELIPRDVAFVWSAMNLPRKTLVPGRETPSPSPSQSRSAGKFETVAERSPGYWHRGPGARAPRHRRQSQSAAVSRVRRGVPC